MLPRSWPGVSVAGLQRLSQIPVGPAVKLRCILIGPSRRVAALEGWSLETDSNNQDDSLCFGCCASSNEGCLVVSGKRGGWGGEELGWDGRLKIRWLHRRLGLTTSAVVVAAGVAAVRAWPHAWQWLIALGLVIAAGAPITISAVSSAQQRRADAARVTRQALQGTTGPGGDILPLVRDSVDLETRVHRAVLPLSYLHRDVEATVRDSLKSGLPVLLVGPSMVGKTKMATTLIKDLFPARRIIIPASREALASLDAADLTLREGVIFLDDINRLIGTDGITDDTIRRLAKASNVIVGTIRASEYDRHQPTDKLRSPEWDTLSMFERIFITRDLSATERHRLDDIIHDEVARKRIFQIGLGEYVGAAERITEALRLGPSVSPVGYALVLGAASWQLAGMSGPVPSERKSSQFL